jgi:hypothetical protein
MQDRARWILDEFKAGSLPMAQRLSMDWITQETTGGEAYGFVEALAGFAVASLRRVAPVGSAGVLWSPDIPAGDVSAKAWAMRFTTALLNEDVPMAHALFGVEWDRLNDDPEGGPRRFAEVLAACVMNAAMVELRHGVG